MTEVQGGPSAPGRIVDPTWVESAELAEPGEEWRGSDDLIAYLEALFDPGEVVGYVVESWDNEGRRVPSGKGPHTETAGEIIERVRKYDDDLASCRRIARETWRPAAWRRTLGDALRLVSPLM